MQAGAAPHQRWESKKWWPASRPPDDRRLRRPSLATGAPFNYTFSRLDPGLPPSFPRPAPRPPRLDPPRGPTMSSLRVLAPILLLVPAAAPAAEEPFGLQRRIPWNDSRIVGS